MSGRCALLLATMLVATLLHRANAAQPLISIDSSSTPLIENFDSMGNSPGALLPSGWVLGNDSLFAIGFSHTDYAAGTSGANVLTGNSRGGYYNFADGETATSTDRSIGFLNDFSSVQNKNLLVGFLNNTGSSITDLHFSYDIEKYRTGTRANDIHVFYGTDGATWTEITDGLQHYAADSAVAVVNPPTTVSKSIDVADLSIPDQAALYFRWYYIPSASNGCQALGIDNFQLTIQSPELQWDGLPGASWDAANTNWKNPGGGQVIWNDNTPNNAIFIDGGAGVGTVVNLTSPRRAGRVTFDAGSKSYTLSGSSLQLSGAGGIGILARSDALIQSAVQITSSQGWDVSSTIAISGPLSLDANLTLTKTGSGTVLLSGPQTIGADSQIKITEGTLRLAANLGNTARLIISGNPTSTDATVILESDQDLADLSISTSDAGQQGLNLASPAASGAFRSLRIHAADLSASKSSLYAAIQQARLTPGDGIFDSSLAAHPGSALGLAEIASGFILIRPTHIGDINLDGAVTISDFIELSSNFGRTGVTWQEGDLNYDGSVTISDFIELASNFGATYAGDAVPISAADQLAINSFAAAHGIAIPEPASICLLLLASLATLHRRRLQSAK